MSVEEYNKADERAVKEIDTLEFDIRTSYDQVMDTELRDKDGLIDRTKIDKGFGTKVAQKLEGHVREKFKISDENWDKWKKGQRPDKKVNGHPPPRPELIESVTKYRLHACCQLKVEQL